MPRAMEWPPMLATASTLPADPQAFAFEFKWDGMRALVDARDTKRRGLRILSRNGLDQHERFPELAGLADALGPRKAVLDGEIVVLDAKGRPEFGRLQPRFGLLDPREIRLQAQVNPAHFLAFDVLGLDGRDVIAKPFAERRRLLESLRFEGPSWATTPSHVGAGEAMLELSRSLGLEGVMAKRLDSTYRPGERSPAWLKVRTRNRQEFVVGGWTPGEGARRGHLGSLLVGVYEGAKRTEPLRYMGRVGSGYDNGDLARLGKALGAIAATRNPFAPHEDLQAMGGDARFVQPELVVEVEFNGLSRHGVLRQASFKGVRTDKAPRQVRWEQAEVKVSWHGPSGADPSVSAS